MVEKKRQLIFLDQFKDRELDIPKVQYTLTEELQLASKCLDNKHFPKELEYHSFLIEWFAAPRLRVLDKRFNNSLFKNHSKHRAYDSDEALYKAAKGTVEEKVKILQQAGNKEIPQQEADHLNARGDLFNVFYLDLMLYVHFRLLMKRKMKGSHQLEFSTIGTVQHAEHIVSEMDEGLLEDLESEDLKPEQDELKLGDEVLTLSELYWTRIRKHPFMQL